MHAASPACLLDVYVQILGAPVFLFRCSCFLLFACAPVFVCGCSRFCYFGADVFLLVLSFFSCVRAPVLLFACSRFLVCILSFLFWVLPIFLFSSVVILLGPGGSLPRSLGSRARSAAGVHPGVPPQSHCLRASGKLRKRERRRHGTIQTHLYIPPSFLLNSLSSFPACT